MGDLGSGARKGQAPLSRIAKDFGISEGTLSNWLKKRNRTAGADRISRVAVAHPAACRRGERGERPRPTAGVPHKQGAVLDAISLLVGVPAILLMMYLTYDGVLT